MPERNCRTGDLPVAAGRGGGAVPSFGRLRPAGPGNTEATGPSLTLTIVGQPTYNMTYIAALGISPGTGSGGIPGWEIWLTNNLPPAR